MVIYGSSLYCENCQFINMSANNNGGNICVFLNESLIGEINTIALINFNFNMTISDVDVIGYDWIILLELTINLSLHW